MIRGVIRNSGVNQDGNTPGITLPSAEAQEALIRKVYADAGLDLADTTYVEAHGTGTAAGDPIETSALSATFGRAREAGNPVWIGSVKSNVGHLEGGSGLVQVIKAIMMLERGEIPPTIFFDKANPNIPMEEWNLAVPTELMPWPHKGQRRISVNSFGYGGTNGFLILDDAYHYLKARGLTGHHNVRVPGPSPASSVDSGVDTGYSSNSLGPFKHGNEQWSSVIGAVDGAHFKPRPAPKLLVWSSHEQAGISRASSGYAAYLDEKLKQAPEELFERRDDAKLLSKLAHTLGARRSVLPWKSFVIANSCKEAVSKFGEATKPIGAKSTKTAPKLGFVFTGQGAQWYAMGRELLGFSVFRESLEAAGRCFVKLGASWSLMSMFPTLCSHKINMYSRSCSSARANT